MKMIKDSGDYRPQTGLAEALDRRAQLLVLCPPLHAMSDSSVQTKLLAGAGDGLRVDHSSRAEDWKREAERERDPGPFWVLFGFGALMGERYKHKATQTTTSTNQGSGTLNWVLSRNSVPVARLEIPGEYHAFFT